MKKIILVFFFLLFISESYAKSKNVQNVKVPDMSKFNKVEDEYRKYLLTISDDIAEEIIKFRQKIAELNQSGDDYMKSISERAKEYIKQEKVFKGKLPLDKVMGNSKVLYKKDDENSKVNSDNVESNFRRYAGNIPAKTMQEIREYKEKVKFMNDQKIKTYMQLSQNAQSYLHQFKVFRTKIELLNKPK